MVSKTNNCFLLLDVGGTFVKSGVASAGELLPEGEFTLPMHSDGGLEQVSECLAAVVRRGVSIASEHGLRLAGIGIAIPGPFDYAAGVSHMRHKFQSLYGVPLRGLLQRLPEVGEHTPVIFVQDVNAALMGELARGNAAGVGNAALVSLGTGLGFALSRNGEVLCSPTGGPAEVIYNRPYREGILEDYASKRGFLHIYAQVTGREPDAELTVADLGRMAGEGDRAALETFARAGAILAAELSGLLCSHRIECLLFGGQISRSFRFMEPALREGLQDMEGLREIAPVKYIGEAAFYGLLSRMEQL